MAEKKYKFSGETKTIEGGTTLHRIQALRDIASPYRAGSFFAKAGDLGGWIEKEDNLSHEGNCWVASSAQVFGNAQVVGDMLVKGNARVFGSAKLFGARDDKECFACVGGHARVHGNAACRNATIRGHAEVCENAAVTDSLIEEYALVCADSDVRFAVISGASSDTLEAWRRDYPSSHGPNVYPYDYHPNVYLYNYPAFLDWLHDGQQ